MSKLSLWNTGKNGPELDSIESAIAYLNEKRRALYYVPTQVIILLLDRFSKRLMHNDDIAYIEGMPYLSRWLRKQNIQELIKNDIGDYNKLDGFINHSDFKLTAQPRGVVSHWLANNVQLLPLYSLFLSVLCKNANMLKIAPENMQLMKRLMGELERVSITYENSIYSGGLITDTVVCCSFTSKNKLVSNALSQSSDFRIVWGSEDAVKGVLSLPTTAHCDTIIFGPKYSFSIIDKESIEADNFEEVVSNAIDDVTLFNQVACSSPHVFYFEKNRLGLEKIIDMIKERFVELNNSNKLNELPQDLCANVLNARAQYYLDPDFNVISANDLSWTILVNDNVGLEEPVNGRTIFVKEIDDIEVIQEFITRKVQCVSFMMKNAVKRERIAKALSYLGIDRICEVGKMHEFTIPWDGMFPLSRMVRWVSLR
jgi:hypothetical protein